MIQKTIKPTEVAIAIREFKMNGKAYNYGDTVADSTIDARKREILCRSGYIVPKAEFDYRPVSGAAPVVAEEAPVVAEVKEEVVAEEAAEAPEAKPAKRGK